MASDRLSVAAQELEDLLLFSDRLTSESGGLLSNFSERLGTFSRQTAPIRYRAKALTSASHNIRDAREQTEQLLSSLDMSRKVQTTITRGPKGQLDVFLTALKELKRAIGVLENNQSLGCVRDAAIHARRIFNEGMHECETDFATTLSENCRMISGEHILKEAGSREEGVELVAAKVLPRLKLLADTMLEGGCKSFVRVYIDIRSDVFERMFQDMGLRDYSSGHLQALPFETFEKFEKKIQKWVQIVGVLVSVLPVEKQTAQQTFPEDQSAEIFSQVVRKSVLGMVQFGEEITLSRHPPEKLFSLLDMYHHLQTSLPELTHSIQDTPCSLLIGEMERLLHCIASAGSAIFNDYQNTIAQDGSKKESADGTVHPLSAGVLSYFKRLLRHDNFMRVLYGEGEVYGEEQFEVGNRMSAAMAHVLMVLQENLENKSKSYKTRALAVLFLMNNVQFMVRSVELSKAIKLLGDDWLSRQKQVVDDHMHQYFKITWMPLMLNINLTGGDWNHSNIQKRNSAIKERFKNFNHGFHEIHESEAEWSIPDAELKSRLKKMILEDLLPSYTEFLARFDGISFAKHPEKYYKYTVAQVEQIVREDLFEGKVVGAGKDVRKSKLDAL